MACRSCSDFLIVVTLILCTFVSIHAYYSYFFPVTLSRVAAAFFPKPTTKPIGWLPFHLKELIYPSADIPLPQGVSPLTPLTSIIEIILFLTFTVLLILTIWSYFAAMFTDPGRVPAALKQSAPRSASLALRLTGGRSLNLCPMCSTYKPLRAHHCSRCRRCVLKYDHHCPWLANCVGFFNYKLYLLVLLYGFLLTLFVTITLSISFVLCAFRIAEGDFAAIQKNKGPSSRSKILQGEEILAETNIPRPPWNENAHPTSRNPLITSLPYTTPTTCTLQTRNTKSSTGLTARVGDCSDTPSKVISRAVAGTSSVLTPPPGAKKVETNGFLAVFPSTPPWWSVIVCYVQCILFLFLCGYLLMKHWRLARHNLTTLDMVVHQQREIEQEERIQMRKRSRMFRAQGKSYGTIENGDGGDDTGSQSDEDYVGPRGKRGTTEFYNPYNVGVSTNLQQIFGDEGCENRWAIRRLFGRLIPTPAYPFSSPELQYNPTSNAFHSVQDNNNSKNNNNNTDNNNNNNAPRFDANNDKNTNRNNREGLPRPYASDEEEEMGDMEKARPERYTIKSFTSKLPTVSPPCCTSSVTHRRDDDLSSPKLTAESLRQHQERYAGDGRIDASEHSLVQQQQMQQQQQQVGDVPLPHRTPTCPTPTQTYMPASTAGIGGHKSTNSALVGTGEHDHIASMTADMMEQWASTSPSSIVVTSGHPSPLDKAVGLKFPRKEEEDDEH